MDRRTCWAMFFSSVVSFQYHPGNKKPLSLAECADVADAMLLHYIAREADKLWAG